MSKTPKKPTGQIGPVRATPGNAEFVPVQFPANKEETEAYFVQAFLVNALRLGQLDFTISEIRQNPVDDLDFTMETSEGRKYLELLEVAPLELLRCGYHSAPDSKNEYDYAEYVLSEVRRKHAKYANNTDIGIVLLIYATDWKLRVTDTSKALLQFWLLQEAHCFERIYLYTPLDDVEGEVNIIFPTPRDYWEGFDPNSYRENTVIHLSPTKWIPLPESVIDQLEQLFRSQEQK